MSQYRYRSHTHTKVCDLSQKTKTNNPNTKCSERDITCHEHNDALWYALQKCDAHNFNASWIEIKHPHEIQIQKNFNV